MHLTPLSLIYIGYARIKGGGCLRDARPKREGQEVTDCEMFTPCIRTRARECALSSEDPIIKYE